MYVEINQKNDVAISHIAFVSDFLFDFFFRVHVVAVDGLELENERVISSS